VADQTTRDDRAAAARSTAFRGFVLVIAASCVAILLLAKGSGESANGAGTTRPRAITATGSQQTTTTVVATAPTTPTAQLSILVVNGAGSKDSRLAGKTRSTLNNLGYTSVKPADSKPKDAYPTTQVWHIPGAESDAMGVARALGLPMAVVVPLPPDPKAGKLANARVVVALGPDAPGIAGGSPASTVSSSAATAPTTATK
jgi:hypothetical protein